MQGLDKKRLTLFVALGSSAIILLGMGIDLILQGDIMYKNDIQSSKLKPIPIHDERDTTPDDPAITLATVHFVTNDVFCVNNPMNITIIAFVNNPSQFDTIIAFPFSVSNNMDMPTTEYVIGQMKKGISLREVTLDRNTGDNSFRGYVTNYNSTSEENLGFLLMPISKGIPQNSTFILNQDPLVIYPATTELQAQTDRDIQRQNIESARTNSHIEGLTLVIIGLVPLGFLWKPSFMDS